MARDRKKLKTEITEMGVGFLYEKLAPLFKDRERLAYMRGVYHGANRQKRDKLERIAAFMTDYDQNPTRDNVEWLLLGLMAEERGE